MKINIMWTNKKIFPVLSLLTFILFLSCDRANNPAATAVSKIVTDLKNEYAPDKRVALFDVEVKHKGENIILAGQTNLPEAKQELIAQMEDKDYAYVDSIELLPSSALEGKTYAIVKISVANIRTRPSHSAELSTQATLGTPLRVLKKERSWYLVQTPDDYLSWVDGGGIQLMDKAQYDEWMGKEKIIFMRPYGFARKQAAEDALPVSDLVMGDVLSRAGEKEGFYKVVFPDGREGFIPRQQAAPYEQWLDNIQQTGQSMVALSKTMMGIPYLWGGTSFKGVDCSGFTKTIYFLHGMVIPRDASQQIRTGELVDSVGDFSNLKPGDLLFFGRKATDSTDERVVHVGMWIGNQEFIHSAGRVHISSMDKDAENYDEYNRNRYLRTKRLLNSHTGDLVRLQNVALY